MSIFLAQDIQQIHPTYNQHNVGYKGKSSLDNKELIVFLPPLPHAESVSIL